MIIDISTVKEFLRIEQDYILEDELIQLMIANAEQYILDVVDNFNYDNDKQMTKAKLLVLVLVNDWYENREYMTDGKVTQKVRHTVQSLLLQLQLAGDELEG